MTNFRCTARVEYTLVSDAPSESALVDFADAVSLERYGEEMDSKDLGDAMGVFMRVAHDDLYDGNLMTLLVGDGFTVNVELEMDLFEWEK